MSSSSTSAKIVSRIPFQHPVQIYNILQVNQQKKKRNDMLTVFFFFLKKKCLRQQEMFNTLFKSIFNETQSEDRSAASVSVSLKDILAGTKEQENEES
jgi:hypothetical protein